MKIETKYNLFDEIYIMYENRIQYNARIKAIKISIGENPYESKVPMKITYIVGNDYFTTECSEDEVFKTKEELIKSL